MDQSSNLDDINDENVLRQMLDLSEDLEFRRCIRARLRQIKKETGKTEEAPAKPHINEAPVEKAKSRSFKPIDSTNSKDSDNKEFMQAFSGLKKPTTSDNNKSEPEKMKLETLVLRSSRPQDAEKMKETGSSRTAFETPSLRKVNPNQKTAETSKPSVISTPKDAFARFKEIDSNSGKSNRLSADDSGDISRRGCSSRRSPSPSSIKEQTLNWCKARVDSYENVEIVDFSSSWSDGLAFCALIHSFYPEAFDYDLLDPKDKKKNFQLAFETAEKFAELPPLLDADDMSRTSNPDWRCVFTYVNGLATRMSEIRKEQRHSQEENEDKTT